MRETPAQRELREAQHAATDNLRRNSGRDQADCEARVDAAEKAAKR
jgi:hypothetical protein